MRKRYLEHGLPINARTTARALNKNFSGQGGNKYLRRLFNGGPVTRGSRLANLPNPAYTTDPSVGTSYSGGAGTSTNRRRGPCSQG